VVARWFVALIEDDKPVEIIDWATWAATQTEERPENSYIVFAKDHMDAFVRAQRGEHLTY
jgi:hypothetical protein